MFSGFGTFGWPEIKLQCQGQTLDGLSYQAEAFRLDSVGNGEVLNAFLQGKYRLNFRMKILPVRWMAGWKVRDRGRETTLGNAVFHIPVLAITHNHTH